MQLMPRENNRSVLILFVILVFIDQLVKLVVISRGFSYALNNGLPILSNISISGIFYFIFSTALVLLFYFMRRIIKVNIDFPIALILSGITSNLIDRLSRDGVVDYINLKIWPIFNISDLFVVIGIILFITKILFNNSKT